MLEWDEIERAVNGCEACRLCKGRHNAVPGEGRRDADIMLIGEGPGEQEDLSGRPFVGPAGSSAVRRATVSPSAMRPRRVCHTCGRRWRWSDRA